MQKTTPPLFVGHTKRSDPHPDRKSWGTPRVNLFNLDSRFIRKFIFTDGSISFSLIDATTRVMIMNRLVAFVPTRHHYGDIKVPGSWNR